MEKAGQAFTDSGKVGKQFTEDGKVGELHCATHCIDPMQCPGRSSFGS